MVIADIVSAIATVGLLTVAFWALTVARRQLKTVTEERTIRLIEEASSPDIEDVVGFLDYAADVRVSRLALSNVYRQLIAARPEAIREKEVDNIFDASIVTTRLMRDDLIPRSENDVSDEAREKEMRARVLAATNYFERISTLVQSELVDTHRFFDDRCYDIVASYFVLEEILYDLCKHEGFDFEEFRYLAVEAQPYLPGWIAKDSPLRTTVFRLLTIANSERPSLRDPDWSPGI